MSYVHGCDMETRKFHGRLWPWKQELLDSNHIIKSFDIKLNSHHILNGIEEKLLG
jgi:hypothetical protein